MSSRKGLARVTRYYAYVFTYGNQYDEENHGFYSVSVKGPATMNYAWTASATKDYSEYQTTQIRNDILRIDFPSSGEYTITVKPISPAIIQFKYWKEDDLDRWINDATWSLSYKNNCSVSLTAQSQPSTPPYGKVTIEYYKDGVLSNSQKQTISGNQYIEPKSIPGYTCNSESQYVRFDNTTGQCNPDTVRFYYKKNSTNSNNSTSSNSSNNNSGNTSSSNTNSTGAIIFPYSWDTQFKPGTATAICEGKVDNENKYVRLPNLYDNNASTTFWWLIWKSERTDNVPEITAYFNSDTVSSVGIRNGNTNSQSDYYKYARVRRFKVRIFYGSGYYQDTYITMNDNYSRDYQKFSLGGTYSNVTRIEFYLDGGANEGFYTGNSETYYIHIADMQFYN